MRLKKKVFIHFLMFWWLSMSKYNIMNYKLNSLSVINTIVLRNKMCCFILNFYKLKLKMQIGIILTVNICIYLYLHDISIRKWENFKLSKIISLLDVKPKIKCQINFMHYSSRRLWIKWKLKWKGKISRN